MTFLAKLGAVYGRLNLLSPTMVSNADVNVSYNPGKAVEIGRTRCVQYHCQ